MLGPIQDLFNKAAELINYLGFWGVGGGMMLESACIPLPSEVVLPVGGFMARNETITLLSANIAAAVGSIIGSLIAYTVGYYGGRPFILKYGKYFFVSEKHFYQADKTFNKYGSAAVFFGRLLPVIRTFISLPAGIARMNLPKFILYSLVGMLPWNFILIYCGYRYGEQAYENIVSPIFHKFEYVVIALFVLLVGFFGAKYFLKYKKGKENKENAC